MFEKENVMRLDIEPEWLNGMEIQEVIISPIQEEIGVMVLTENFQKRSKNITVRIYSLIKTENDSYLPYNELQAFSFRSFLQADEFITKLPEMTGLDMLFLLYSPYNAVTLNQ